MKKIAVMLVAVLMMTTLFSCATAENAQPYYSHVLVITSGLSISESGVAHCLGAGTSKYDDTYTEVYVTLQKCPLSGLQLWSLEGMWSTSSAGVISAALERYVDVEPGYKYRVYTCARIKDADGNILETVGLFSRTVSYAAE